nr:colicin E3/pyocin S6 family cytotoxin [Klebsiella pneumoniae]
MAQGTESLGCHFALSRNRPHLGAFDPKTGKQVKGPDPKRNIKKYL